jgi:hypothetical protein
VREKQKPTQKNNFGFVFACSVFRFWGRAAVRSGRQAGSAVRSCSGGRRQRREGRCGELSCSLQCSRLDAFSFDDFLATCVCCCS